MSALAMILTAAMMIPGDGPEKTSGKVSEKERGLDLKGKWEGSLGIKLPDGSPSTVPVTYQDGKLTAGDLEEAEAVKMKVLFIDEGHGKCWCRYAATGKDALGIYKWQRDQLFICISEGKGRPTNFMVEETSTLLTLHRIKPRK
jgi:hypothetical protein